MRNEATRKVYEYWLHIKGDRPAPLRSEIDPAALRRLLPYLFILTPGAEGVLEFRLAGTRICEIFGRELRGAAFTGLWDENPNPAEIARDVMRREQPAILDGWTRNGETAIGFEVLLLPLSSGEQIDRLLGSLLPQASPAPPVTRPLSGLSLHGWNFLETDREAASDPTDDPGPARALLRFLSTRLLDNGAT
ncbi:PAS domain-containing protein [Rhizobium sp. LCM 4573]|uniref:PAS domain-containing protein n=1 Tax=Rhizobium sp. LCM 4573 TaxID=1848291 RepID=UPI0008D9F651|nr:PAS domain-containing protein [Rhizobium sp. LCM 4573]OHV81483.1 hypothetical protein LCM4573_20515 [Rhizobium sp. LCM 4573]